MAIFDVIESSLFKNSSVVYMESIPSCFVMIVTWELGFLNVNTSIVCFSPYGRTCLSVRVFKIIR